MYVCVYIYTYVYIYVYICIHMYIYTINHIFWQSDICIFHAQHEYIYKGTHVYVYVVYVYIYICIWCRKYTMMTVVSGTCHMRSPAVRCLCVCVRERESLRACARTHPFSPPNLPKLWNKQTHLRIRTRTHNSMLHEFHANPSTQIEMHLRYKTDIDRLTQTQI